MQIFLFRVTPFKEIFLLMGKQTDNTVLKLFLVHIAAYHGRVSIYCILSNQYIKGLKFPNKIVFLSVKMVLA